MNSSKTYRTNGAVGALLDEYERAVLELKVVITSLSSQELRTVVDKETKDMDCVSIQSILTHVVRAGYNYVVYIRNEQGERNEFIAVDQYETAKDYQAALDRMFAYNEKLFKDYPNLKLDENDLPKKIKTNWGQSYDVEQLMEHAIVHVLRHRRQIERFIIKLKKLHSPTS